MDREVLLQEMIIEKLTDDHDISRFDCSDNETTSFYGRTLCLKWKIWLISHMYVNFNQK